MAHFKEILIIALLAAPGILAQMDEFEGESDFGDDSFASGSSEFGSFSDGDGDAGKGHHDHHHHKAHSFQHHHGPVSGHHVKVEWKDKHGHHDWDYKAHPHYKFAYGVKDHHTKDFKGQLEHRDGKDVVGEYHIHEPGGNVRTVKYHSDPHTGFYATVHNHGGNDHSGGSYGHKR